MDEMLLKGCGLLVTFVGTLLEGEISMITSIIGAKSGYYNIYLAMLMGFSGALVADWFKYLVGKTQGKKILGYRPKLQAKFNKASLWFDKHPYLILTFYKLFFGMTTVILIMAGLKGISYFRFAIHSAISVAIWVGILTSLTYLCAETILLKIEQFSSYKTEILIGLSFMAFLYWLLIKRPHQKECLE